MHQTFNRRSVLGYAVGGAAGAVLLSSTKSGQAAAMKFKADLKASSEVPPTTSSGTGSVTASYDPATKMLTWEGKFSGLTGPATAAHFHGPAEAGKNAGVFDSDFGKGQALYQPVQRLGDAYRRAGCRPGKRLAVRQRPHRSQ